MRVLPWFCIGYLLLAQTVVCAMGNDDPLITSFSIDKLERSDDETSWDLALVSGHDYHKFVLESKGHDESGEKAEHSLTALYQGALSPYWNWVIGATRDYGEDDRTWGTLGLRGMLPYFVETELELSVGEGGQSRLDLEAEKEIPLNLSWTLVSEIEFTAFGRDETDHGIQSGLAESEFSLRLFYQLSPDLYPYIGATWSRVHGDSARELRRSGQVTHDSAIIFGVSVTF